MPTATLNTVELSALYDRIYDIADRLIKKYNPCNICIKNNKTLCTYYTIDKHDEFYLPQNKLCCLYCSKGYWSKRGCTVKSLGCKLFLCQAITNKILKRRFKKLREYSRKHLNFTYNNSSWGNQIFTYSVVDKYYTPKEDWLKLMKDKL